MYIWLEPALHCKVQYLEKTRSGMLRIASFIGLILFKIIQKTRTQYVYEFLVFCLLGYRQENADLQR